MEEARKRAATDPLPGPLAEAFLSDSIKVGQINVRRVVASDWPILKQLNSPIYLQWLEMQKAPEIREEVPFTDEQAYEMCWQFTHTPKESRVLLVGGVEAYRLKATEEIADMFDLATLTEIVNAIQQQLMRSSRSVLKLGSGESEEPEKKTIATAMA